jgi:hypothetical protein
MPPFLTNYQALPNGIMRQKTNPEVTHAALCVQYSPCTHCNEATAPAVRCRPQPTELHEAAKTAGHGGDSSSGVRRGTESGT